MCGRYASFLPAEFIARLFVTVNPLPNLAIQDRMPVIIERQDWPWQGEADGDPSPLCPTP
jgi:putative SOS response-associated peptidase YedK